VSSGILKVKDEDVPMMSRKEYITVYQRRSNLVLFLHDCEATTEQLVFGGGFIRPRANFETPESEPSIKKDQS